MDVICRKYSCKFNDGTKCSRKNLTIDKRADCKDIEIDKTKPVKDISKDMFEHEPDIAPYHHCKNMNIRCEQPNCVFNKTGECYSNGIFIGSEKQEAPCNSYAPR